MNTSRVPGVTRNSGWPAGDALIVEPRTLRVQLSNTRSAVAPHEERAMTATWIDVDSRWRASGQLQADGSLRGAAVDDPNGITRVDDLSFRSKAAFTSWLRQLGS